MQTKYTEDDNDEYMRSRNQVKVMIRNANQKIWEEFGTELNWGKSNEKKKKKKKEIKGVKDENNVFQLNTIDILKVWRDHYERKFDQAENGTESAWETMVEIQEQRWILTIKIIIEREEVASRRGNE